MMRCSDALGERGRGRAWLKRFAVVAHLAFVAAACSSEDAAKPRDNAREIGDLTCSGDSGTPTPLRRLTRFEYANALADIFGEQASVGEAFPRDELALGFDNQVGALSHTDLHVEGYLQAAESVSSWIRADVTRLARVTPCLEASPDCARAVAGALGRRLLRRPLRDGELDSLLLLFEGDYAEGAYAEGASRVVAALLQSPEFLYRLERAPAEVATSVTATGDSLASPWVLAARLSFLILGSGPDEWLLELAARGALATAADVERTARTLLEDHRAHRGVAHFYAHWLDLTELPELEKDRRLFSDWDDTLRDDLSRETARFVDAVLWEDDARIATLLQAPYSFLNASLRDFYGLPVDNPDATQLGRVVFPAHLRRGGLLTQAAVLSTHAKADQTSPIHRGKFIREQFFCVVPPPPPPNVIVAPPELDPRKTTRERFQQHRADPSCAGCHELLDPVGLVFENYDAIGRHRETEAGVPIDASGYLVGTDVDGPLSSVPDLALKLTRSSEVRQCVVKQWFRYAFGRGETDSDACTLRNLEEVFAASHGDLQELLVALTQTNPFLRPSPAPLTVEEAL